MLHAWLRFALAKLTRPTLFVVIAITHATDVAPWRPVAGALTAMLRRTIMVSVMASAVARAMRRARTRAMAVRITRVSPTVVAVGIAIDRATEDVEVIPLAEPVSDGPTVAVATVIIRSIPIIIVVVIRGVGNTATMANPIAIDPVAMPESTVMHLDDYSRITADVIAFVKVKICCRSRVREGHQGTGECGLQCY